MKTKQQTGVATVIERQPDETKEEDGSEGLKACARDLIDAISSGDESKVAAAIKAAFEICDSQPHSEGPHTNENEES